MQVHSRRLGIGQGVDHTAVLCQQRDLSHCHHARLGAGNRQDRSSRLTGGCVALADAARRSVYFLELGWMRPCFCSFSLRWSS